MASFSIWHWIIAFLILATPAAWPPLVGLAYVVSG